jgi:trk system potassium uptake protein TrkH
MDFRPILLVIGILLSTLALVMLIPAAVDAFAGNSDWEVFTISSGVTLFVGVAMALNNRAGKIKLNLRQAFAMTTLSWVAITFFAALPFVYSELQLSFRCLF